MLIYLPPIHHLALPALSSFSSLRALAIFECSLRVIARCRVASGADSDRPRPFCTELDNRVSVHRSDMQHESTQILMLTQRTAVRLTTSCTCRGSIISIYCNSTRRFSGKSASYNWRLASMTGLGGSLFPFGDSLSHRGLRFGPMYLRVR